MKMKIKSLKNGLGELLTMIKKKIMLISIITLFLLMQFSGCAGKVESETVLQEPEPEMEIEVHNPDHSYDQSSCSPWQLAYLDLIEEICHREAPVRTEHSEGISDEDDVPLSDSYCLYDVDKDKIPEIFIRFGSCEADYRTEVYTYRNEEAVLIGDYPSGHSCLYTWPEENAALYVWGHMGCAEMDKISIVNESLVFEEIFTEDISNNPDLDYTAVDKIVPGAAYLTMFRIMLNPPGDTPLTLPIYDYNKFLSSIGKPAIKGETDKKAIEEVLSGDRKLYGVSGDGFGGDTGLVYLADYCKPGFVDQYIKQPLQIQKKGWLDFNQDGREECVILLGESEDMDGIDEKYVILSVQDDIVYAYCINYYCNYEVYQNGDLTGEDGQTSGVSFYKNQCYLYSKPYDNNELPITWEIYSGR